jgi:hypothetical protein
MFNQMQRHAASRAVANRIQMKTATKSTQEFIDLVSDRNFLKNLQEAIQDSSSPEAKNLEHQLRYHLDVTTSKVPWSPGERGGCLSKLFGYISHFWSAELVHYYRTW